VAITASVKVTYWLGEGKIDGIDEFSEELSKEYISIVRGRRAGLGGGLYQLSVEFLSHLTLKEIATFILEGLAYDAIKTATTEFVIRPFLEAYRRMKARPANRRVDIDSTKFTFQDTNILINRLPHTDLLSELEGIMLSVAQNVERLTELSEDRIFEIRVPVVEDYTPDSVCRFRDLTWVDEPIEISRISASDYFKYWGVEYDIRPRKVYDVQSRSFIAEAFYKEMEYWELQRKAREKKQAQ
jgi:hypothetical protein